MSKLTINIKSTGDREAKAALVRLASPASRREATKAGGISALGVIRRYYAMGGRNLWTNPALPTHGAGRKVTQWWRSTETGWDMKQPNTYTVNFTNATIGLAHKVTGGTIKPKRKKFLTIPVTPEAHGLDAKTFSRTIAPLFAAKGMLMFKDPATDEVKAAYALKTSVTHKPWPKALPPEASYLDAFLNEALDSLIGTFNQP